MHDALVPWGEPQGLPFLPDVVKTLTEHVSPLAGTIDLGFD